MKVLTIVGTRPELIKLSRVIAEFDVAFDHILVHTGQNFDWELNGIFFDEMGIRKPDHFLDIKATTPSAAVARVIERVDTLLTELRPDALLLLGDTNSCLAAYPAKRQKIPIFHMEAGNRCFDMRVPEEINRRIVDHLSDINLAYTEHARRYLLAEGIRPETIIVTGSPMREVLDHHRESIEASTILRKLGLEKGKYFLWSTHREENIEDTTNFAHLIDTLHMMTENWQIPIVLSTHPRTRKRIQENGISLPEGVLIHKPFGFFDYIRLQQMALCTLSDSGTLTEESSILDFPAVMLRDTHERPEGMDEGTVIMSGLSPKSVKEAVKMVIRNKKTNKDRSFHLVSSYEPSNISLKTSRIVLSYVNYINLYVWKK